MFLLLNAVRRYRRNDVSATCTRSQQLLIEFPNPSSWYRSDDELEKWSGSIGCTKNQLHRKPTNIWHRFETGHQNAKSNGIYLIYVQSVVSVIGVRPEACHFFVVIRTVFVITVQIEEHSLPFRWTQCLKGDLETSISLWFNDILGQTNWTNPCYSILVASCSRILHIAHILNAIWQIALQISIGIIVIGTGSGIINHAVRRWRWTHLAVVKLGQLKCLS